MFFERDNYLYFLKGVRKYLCEYVDVLAYSLMPTHYHLLGRVKPQQQLQTQTSEVLKTSEVSASASEVSVSASQTFAVETSRRVSLAMQKFGISYTKAINKHFGRVGALFQGQFQGKPVKNYEHLLTLCIYIHANPVKDGLVALPEDWEYSNYLDWMGLRAGTLVNRAFIAENFGSPGEYCQLVMEYIKTRNLPEDIREYLLDLEK